MSVGASSRGDRDSAPLLTSSNALSTPKPSPSLPRGSQRRQMTRPGRIRVVVRCRPLLPSTEADHTCHRIHIGEDDDSVVVNDVSGAGDARQFSFDRVLTPSAGQVDCFAEVAPLVDHVLDGYHATVFAYGQTGSGKTFTMDGLNYLPTKHGGSVVPDVNTPVEQHGIMPRTIQLLFDKVRERQRASAAEAEDADSDSTQSGEQFRIKCSFFQLYNERITDLLRPSTSVSNTINNGAVNSASGARQRGGGGGGLGNGEGLRLRWHHGDHFRVENLFVCECDSAEKMRAVLLSGIKEKVVSSHLMNQQSSRSHCVFTIYVEVRQASGREVVRRAELSLVDLAGSERLGLLARNPSAKLMRESIEINTSLLALGKVITALASGRGKSGAGKAGAASTGHVPYRDSKLTKLLKHALGGNSVTVMIACISPSDRYVEESVSTLLYAGRARNIENVPSVNEDPTTALIRQLREEVRQLKQELAYYRALATSSLAERERHVREVGGGGVHSSSNWAVASHVAAESSGVFQPASLPRSGEDDEQRALDPEAERLADSLLNACEMLRHLMTLNGQLRDAYDTIKSSMDAAEVREIQLNAENLALRERIEMLESIALNEEFAAVEEAVSSSPAPPEVEDASSSSTSGNEDREPTSRPPSTPHAADREKRAPLPLADRSEAPPTDTTPPAGQLPRRAEKKSTRSSSPSVVVEKMEAVVLEDVRVSRHRASPHPSPPSSGKQKQEPQPAEDPPRRPGVPPPRRSRSITRSQPSRKKSKRKHRRLARQLAAYEAKYRAPARTETYADYYGRGSRYAPLPPDVAPLITETVKEMKAVVQKLPASVVPSLVPSSLLAPGQFGTLAYCGASEEITELEARRRDREARRQVLLQRQTQLHAAIQIEIHRARDGGSGGTDSGSASASSMKPPPTAAASVASVYASSPAPPTSTRHHHRHRHHHSKATVAIPTDLHENSTVSGSRRSEAAVEGAGTWKSAPRHGAQPAEAVLGGTASPLPSSSHVVRESVGVRRSFQPSDTPTEANVTMRPPSLSRPFPLSLSDPFQRSSAEEAQHGLVPPEKRVTTAAPPAGWTAQTARGPSCTNTALSSQHPYATDGVNDTVSRYAVSGRTRERGGNVERTTGRGMDRLMEYLNHPTMSLPPRPSSARP